jgi:hypothetical protein
MSGRNTQHRRSHKVATEKQEKFYSLLIIAALPEVFAKELEITKKL